MKSSRAKRNIAWIENYCRIPEGKDVGKPVKLRKWQRDEIVKIYDNPHGTRRAILSFGRKNAKTTLSAFLCLLHLCGPEAMPNSQLFSAAQSRDQAAILFALAAKVVRMSPDLLGVVTVRDTAKQLFCQELGTLYRALSADASTAYGLSPSLVIHDELGQVKGPNSELYDALETATGAQEDPLSIVISTQAPTDGDLLSILIDDALAAHDPKTVVSLHTAPMDMDPFSVKAMKIANPAFGDFLNAELVKDMAESARRMPSREAQYRNLVLNQRVDATTPFISRSAWEACNATVRDFDGFPVYGGLDLSAVNDLTALVLISPIADVFHVKPTFWLPGDGIAEKSRADRVPYDVWAKEGHLQTTPGKTIDYDFVAVYLFQLFQSGLDIRNIAFDRWGWKHFRASLLRAGFTEDQTDGDEAIFSEFGQGFQSMSPALRELESDILQERIAHGGHPVLTMCMANSVVTSDPAGNRKLNKAKSSGRIDGAVALAMARGVASTWEEMQAAITPWDADPEFRLEL